MGQILSDSDFLSIIKTSLLVAFDYIIRNENSEILLGLRNNSPAHGFWFVPGGRILKEDSLIESFYNILRKETGIVIDNIDKIEFKGIYEHIYPDNFFNHKDISTHYIVLAYNVFLKGKVEIVSDQQNRNMRYFAKEDIISSSKVHEFTRNYFIEKPENKLIV